MLKSKHPMIVDGHATTFTIVPSLVDTNVLVYRYDLRCPAKQRIATDLLREGIELGTLIVPHQVVIEFVAATTRRSGTQPVPDSGGYRQRAALTLRRGLIFARRSASPATVHPDPLLGCVANLTLDGRGHHGGGTLQVVTEFEGRVDADGVMSIGPA